MTRCIGLGLTRILVLFVLLLPFALSGFGETVDGYAVLMEVDAYFGNHQDLPIGYVHIAWVTEMLRGFGWEQDHILVKKDAEVTRDSLIDTIDWLAERADSDDLIVFLIAAHGSYITNELQWHETFPDLWASLATSRKLLIVDACHSGGISSTAVYGSIVPPSERTDGAAEPGIALAGVAYDEYAWVGIPEENDPIVGSPFLYYLVPALTAEGADLNGDGAVSIEEAFASAVPPTRAYYRDVVFGAHPENVAAFRRLHASFDPNEFPHPDIIDAYPGEMILDLAWYRTSGSD
ncbi:caspase family protein [Candidatus Bipolaricaulota bacterium]